LDKLRAADYLHTHAMSRSSGHCARSVRLALEASGLDTRSHPESAKDYGPFLISLGFVIVRLDNYAPMTADVAVLQPFEGGDPNGHVEMYDGQHWVSDFVQKDIFAGPGWRQAVPNNAQGQVTSAAVGWSLIKVYRHG
jgi:hypothetical protein